MSNRLEYKGYHTNIEIDFEANEFYGEIDDIQDFVNFMSDVSKGTSGIIREFHCAVDDYIDFCQAVGKQPQQPIAEAFRSMREMRIPTPTVGEILREEFMKPLNMSVKALAEGIELSENETRELLAGKLAITPELSQRLAEFLGMSDLFFYRLQLNLDRRKAILGHEEIREHELALA